MISSPVLHRLQRRHFLLFDIGPAIGTVAALALAAVRPPSWTDLALFAGFWLATGLGITVGYHRYFSHRAFAAHPAVAAALLIMGSMSGRGPMISWAAMHRRHHELSDKPGDMHSPHPPGASPMAGWLHAHATWMLRHDYPNVAHYVPDLLRNRFWMRLNQRYRLWVVLGLAAPAAIGGLVSHGLYGALTGFLWGGAVRMFAVEQAMSSINSFCHLIGSRPFAVRDHSRNLSVLSLVTWGEAWHNNHHAFPNSAAFGLRWYQLDPGFWLIRVLAAIGLVREVRLPTAQQRAAKAEAPGEQG